MRFTQIARQVQQTQQIWNVISNAKGFDKNMKWVKLLSAGDGRAKCEFTVQPEHTNMGGTMHGGYTATIVDVVSTMALLSTEPFKPGVSVELSVSYVRAAPIGETVTIDASATKIGKTLAFLNVDLTDSQGRMIAHGKHTKFFQSDDS